jgi:hypothetical protein
LMKKHWIRALMVKWLVSWRTVWDWCRRGLCIAEATPSC